ncbi:MAG: cytochrome c [Steroidobacteraceae bacterium]|jgi:mono/diheme cytochrome c family protein|nr:cytochrome c [Steroidobacteraceae bacterium]
MRKTVAAALAATLSLLVSSCGGDGGRGGAPNPGARVYSQHCMACHQRNGRGLGETQPSLVGTPTVSGDPAALIAWVAFGVRPPGLVRGRSLVVMPHFHWLSDDDLAAVLTHVRSSFGNDYPPITAAMVAEVRAAQGAR